MSELVLMADPQIADLPVQESGEPLVDLRERARLLVAPRPAWTGPHWCFVRASLAARLERAANALPSGIRLLIVEGYRDPARQRASFEAYASGLREADPHLPEATIHRLASRYIAPPEVAPHGAGAAVDLTLADADGTPLDLGTDIDATPEESAGACFTAAAIAAPARENRDLLITALTGAGLVNYPTEWWHWSYGDRYWAWRTGATAALFGPIEIS